MKYPRQANNEGGWILDYRFLKRVSEMTRERDAEYCQMEQVEIALLCAEELMKEKERTEIDRLRKALDRISVTFGEFECQRLAKEALAKGEDERE